MTANGNIPLITTPGSHGMMGGGGEGYGICNESPAVEYHDYANGDTGNWGTATVLSLTKAAIKIARTTSDGHWTLTQTITNVPKTSSITVVMALTNTQAVDKVAYLIRYADVNANGIGINVLGTTVNGTFAWSFNGLPPRHRCTGCSCKMWAHPNSDFGRRTRRTSTSDQTRAPSRSMTRAGLSCWTDRWCWLTSDQCPRVRRKP